MRASRLAACLFAVTAMSSPLAQFGSGSAHAEPAPAADPGARKPATALVPARQPAVAKSDWQLKPMTVTLVRAANCSINCPEWIAATGMIDATTPAKFRKVLKDIGERKVPVLISSNGGLVDESLSIGRLLRAKGLDIAVANTIITPCPAGSAQCTPSGEAKAYLARCASSCAFLLAGGVRRYAGARTPVGVHQLRSLQTTARVLQKFKIEQQYIWGIPTETRRTLISEKRIGERTVETRTPASAYSKVAAYFRDMGVTDAVMPLVRNTPHTSIHWLTRSELASTHLATDMIDGEQLIARTLHPLAAVDGRP